MQDRSTAINQGRTVVRARQELIAGVLRDLQRSPKQISPVWFYDELGSFLFDAICELPEYYLTRTELSIMDAHAAEMAQCIGPAAAIVEYGSGTSLKTRLLLNQLETPRAYVPVEISRTHLMEAARQLARDYRELPIVPVCADFTQPFELPLQAAIAERKVVYFPGSTIGNFDRDAAKKLLMGMHLLIGARGAVLIGVDLKKDKQKLERAYNDSQGVTAEFNINALRHLNRELDTNFRLDNFEHRAVWNEHMSRVEMHLVSRTSQSVRVGSDVIHIARGEHLLTEYCHKYTLESFAHLATEAGFQVQRVWSDRERAFSVQLLEPQHLQ